MATFQALSDYEFTTSPHPTTIALPNGLTVLLATDHRLIQASSLMDFYTLGNLKYDCQARTPLAPFAVVWSVTSLG